MTRACSSTVRMAAILPDLAQLRAVTENRWNITAFPKMRAARACGTVCERRCCPPRIGEDHE